MPALGVRLVGVIASVVIGALTHVLWDGLTHEGRWVSTLLPGLDTTVAGLPIFRLLQYASSVLGLVVVTVWVVRVLRDNTERTRCADEAAAAHRRPTAPLLGPGVSFVGLAILLGGLIAYRQQGSVVDTRVVVAAITRGVTAVLATVFGYGVVYTLATRPVRSQRSRRAGRVHS